MTFKLCPSIFFEEMTVHDEEVEEGEEESSGDYSAHVKDGRTILNIID